MNMADIGHLETLRGELKSDEPMARHVSWRAGGSAARAYWPADRDDLVAFVKTLAPDEPLCFVGLGSNLLVRDGGYRGTVVFPHGRLDRIAVEIAPDGSRFVAAEAGVAAPKVARFAARHAMSGAEFLAGVPGTVGGALAMNAGCYGAETWEYVDGVTTVDRSGRVRERPPADFEIGYRHVELGTASRSGSAPVSAAENRMDAGSQADSPPGLGVTEWFMAARFRFPDGDEGIAKARIREWLTRRIATQPLEQPNAGSTFRNPDGDHAARLIELCGLKGFSIGGAQVSAKHANFIVNTGAATAHDIEELIHHMHDTVQDRTGVDLVREVRIIG